MQLEVRAPRCRYELVRARARSLASFQAKPPVDAGAALRSVARVYLLPDSPRDAFAMLNRTSGRYGVVINPCVPATRMRWTSAHELGHIVLGHIAAVNGSLDAGLLRWAEREASVFAEEFLMPWPLFEHRSFRTVESWADLFGVSCEAMSRRLVQVPSVHPAYGTPWLGLSQERFETLMWQAETILAGIRAARSEAR